MMALKSLLTLCWFSLVFASKNSSVEDTVAPAAQGAAQGAAPAATLAPAPKAVKAVKAVSAPVRRLNITETAVFEHCIAFQGVENQIDALIADPNGVVAFTQAFGEQPDYITYENIVYVKNFDCAVSRRLDVRRLQTWFFAITYEIWATGDSTAHDYVLPAWNPSQWDSTVFYNTWDAKYSALTGNSLASVGATFSQGWDYPRAAGLITTTSVTATTTTETTIPGATTTTVTTTTVSTFSFTSTTVTTTTVTRSTHTRTTRTTQTRSSQTSTTTTCATVQCQNEALEASFSQTEDTWNPWAGGRALAIGVASAGAAAAAAAAGYATYNKCSGNSEHLRRNAQPSYA